MSAHKNMRKQFIAGSRYFFENYYNDYIIHDTDYVVIDDELDVNYRHEYDKETKTDYFIWKKHPPEWFVDNLIGKDGFALDVAKNLVPEVNEYLNFTMEHLKQVRPIVDKLEHHAGSKYIYYKTIYDAYIENGSFALTDEQRLKAYDEYRKHREEYTQFFEDDISN